jgi:hypothetical protein
MKRIVIALIFIANIALLSSCEKDRCPQHGYNVSPKHQTVHRA